MGDRDRLHDDADVLLAELAEPPLLSCSWTADGDRTAEVRVTGALDLATVPELRTTLRRPDLQADVLLLDLRDLAFMDVSGMRAILEEADRARLSGRRLTRTRATSAVERVFTLLGLADEIEAVDLRDGEPALAALARLDGPAQ